MAATDENGDLRWKKSYLAYGQAQGDDHDNRFGYTGHTEESDGLVYTGARYYHPSIGRFISPDPVGFLESNSASFNRYAYANNNPYRYTDPNGQLPIIPIVIGVIKVADMAITAYEVYAAAQSGGALGAAKAVADNVKYSAVPGGKIVSKVAGSTKKTYYSKKDRLEAHRNADGKCEYCGKENQTHTPFKSDSAEGITSYHKPKAVKLPLNNWLILVGTAMGRVVKLVKLLDQNGNQQIRINGYGIKLMISDLSLNGREFRRDFAVYCCPHVFNFQRPILLVIRDPEGDWQFLCGKNDDTEGCNTVGIGHLLDRDPYLAQFANLEAGTGVERDTTGNDWTYFQLDE